jgi:hypothetical protein
MVVRNSSCWRPCMVGRAHAKSSMAPSGIGSALGRKSHELLELIKARDGT